jgi:hypothetical protein
MSKTFNDSIVDKNKMLLDYRNELDKYDAAQTQILAARNAYLGCVPGSVEYVNKQQEYYKLLGYPIPLPVKTYSSNFKIDYEKPKLKRKIIKKPKKPKNTASNSNTNNTNTNTRTKARMLQEAIQTTFKFKNLEECTSRNKDIFVSKNDMITAIKGNLVLARHVGDFPKSISKEDLCKRLFSKI